MINQEKKALADWLLEQEYTVFGTLKFADGYSIQIDQAEKIVLQFFNKLDRVYFGNATTNKNIRHERAAFLHKGISRENTHYHFLAKPDIDPVLFCRLARKQWAIMSTKTMSYKNTQIELIRNNDAAANYILHEYNTLGSDTLLTSATHINPLGNINPAWRSLHRLRRLLILDNLVDS